MKTSFFELSGRNKNAVAICRYVPSCYSGRIYKKLAPSETLIRDWKCGDLSQEDYEIRYYKECLSMLDPVTVYDELGESAILLCYEKPNEFCHRHLVANWITRSTKINVSELDYNKQEDLKRFME